VEDKGKILNEDEEYDRLMSKLDELEKEELAAEAADNIEEETNEVDPDVVSDQSSFHQNLKDLEVQIQYHLLLTGDVKQITRKHQHDTISTI